MQAQRPGPRAAAAMIVVSTLIAMSLLIYLTAARKTSIEHDEGITYLAASAQQGAYDDVTRSDARPAGVWVPASVWQGYLQPMSPMAFKTIRDDLARVDIHPPVYFWLLHLWSLVVGLTPASAIALNILLALATGLALFVLAERTLGEPLRAATVVVFWALAPPVIGVSVIARQYGLLALFTVLTALFAHIIATTPRPGVKHGLAFAVVVVLGAATHYHYVVVLSGVLIWLAVVSLREPRRLLVALGGTVAGTILFALLQPGLQASLSLQREQAQALDRQGLVERLRQTLAALTSFFARPALKDWFLETGKPVRGRVVVAGSIVTAAGAALWWAFRDNRDDDSPQAARRKASRRSELAHALHGGLDHSLHRRSLLDRAQPRARHGRPVSRSGMAVSRVRARPHGQTSRREVRDNRRHRVGPCRIRSLPALRAEPDRPRQSR